MGYKKKVPGAWSTPIEHPPHVFSTASYGKTGKGSVDKVESIGRGLPGHAGGRMWNWIRVLHPLKGCEEDLLTAAGRSSSFSAVSIGMAQCQAKNSRGEQCGRFAGDKAYCPFHLKRYSQNTTHGLTAQPRTLGIPEAYDDVYQEFYQSDAPTDLRRELAMARTIFVEVREALLSGDKRDECAVKIVGLLKDHLADVVDPHVLDTYGVSMVEALVDLLKPYMPLTTMRLDTADTLTKMLDKIASIAQKMKRIQEGMVLKVEMDQRIIVQFVQHVIFPVITDTEQRRQIADRASQFALRRSNVEEARPSGPLSRAEQGPEILQHL